MKVGQRVETMAIEWVGQSVYEKVERWVERKGG